MVVRAMNSTTEKILLTFGLLFSLFAAVFPYFIVPSFSNVFATFGTELPFATQFALNYHATFFLVPIFVLLSWFFWPTKSRRGIAACIIGLAGSGLCLVFMLGALYFPIFIMAPSV